DAGFCPFDGTLLVFDVWQAPVDPLVGAVIDGRYQVEGVLGEGGMGTVYRVRHLALERALALKVLRADLAQDGELAARFLQEAQATASIKHPGIVQITDFGKLQDGRPYFVMELLAGQTLAQALRTGGPLPSALGARVAVRVAQALDAAHKAGVIHRDLKPDNIFLLGNPTQGDLETRVVDFGAAVVLGKSRLTKKGIVFGTPHYMSPEQAAGRPIDHRVDIYALGIILYEMFTGRVPFEGDTYMGVLTQHMFAQPTPPTQLKPELARDLGVLEPITLRALEKEPSARYGSMEELAAALEGALHGVDIAVPSRRSGTPPPLADRMELPSVEEIHGAMSRTHERRSGLWLPLSLGGLLALAALGVVVWRVAPRGMTAAPTQLEPVASLASVAPPLPSARTVSVTATAPGTLYLGSALVGPLPASLRVESGTPARTYTIRAPGFASQDVLVGEASSAHIDVQLEKLEKVEAPKIVPAASHAPPPPTAPTAKLTGGGIIVDPWK
ncbi:MAG TPA: serine/threonine-protein kinase, partial [Polyangiaceae bacterium]